MAGTAGLARFCTEPYQEPQSDNLDHAFMHLTNHAVNRSNTQAHSEPPGEDLSDDGDHSNATKWTFAALRSARAS